MFNIGISSNQCQHALLCVGVIYFIMCTYDDDDDGDGDGDGDDWLICLSLNKIIGWKFPSDWHVKIDKCSVLLLANIARVKICE